LFHVMTLTHEFDARFKSLILRKALNSLRDEEQMSHSDNVADRRGSTPLALAAQFQQRGHDQVVWIRRDIALVSLPGNGGVLLRTNSRAAAGSLFSETSLHLTRYSCWLRRARIKSPTLATGKLSCYFSSSLLHTTGCRQWSN